MIGTDHSDLFLYTLQGDDLKGTFERQSTETGSIREGRWTAPAVFDIDNDGVYEVLVGGLRGGLSLFKTDIMTSGMSANESMPVNELYVYPNPAQSILNIDGEEIKGSAYTIFNTSGNLIQNGILEQNQISVANLISGMYVIKISTKEGTYTLRWVKI